MKTRPPQSKYSNVIHFTCAEGHRKVSAEPVEHFLWDPRPLLASHRQPGEIVFRPPFYFGAI